MDRLPARNSHATRVLFLQSQTYFGADSMVHSLLMRHLDREAFEVEVACNPGTNGRPSPALAKLSTLDDLRLRRTSFGPSRSRRSRTLSLQTLLEALRASQSLGGLALHAKRSGVAVIHGTEKPRDAFTGVALGKLTGARSIVHMHIGYYPQEFSRPVRWAVRHADRVLCISDFVARTVVEAGVDPSRIRRVHNAIEPDAWDPSIDGADVRHELGLAPDAPVLAIISRIYAWKGHTEVLRAVGRVAAEVPDVRLLVVGVDDPRAHPGGGSYTDELRTLAKSLGIAENVIFTGYRGDVDRILAAADAFVQPSWEEPFGIVYLEAMAMRRPVLAARSGGAVEVVDEGKSGLLSERGNDEELAANMLTLIRDPELRDRMGAYGRERVERYFNPQRMARETEHVYSELTATAAAVAS